MAISHEDGTFKTTIRLGRKVPVVPGVYSILSSSVHLTLTKNCLPTAMYLERTVQDGLSRIVIEPGENEIVVGLPFRLEFFACRFGADRKNYVIDSVWVVGAGGATFPTITSAGRSQLKIEQFIRAGGREYPRYTMEYG